MLISLEAMLTIHPALFLTASIAFTDFTSIVIPLKTMFTKHGAHDIRTSGRFLALAHLYGKQTIIEPSTQANLMNL